MARPVETQMTITFLQCYWSDDTTNSAAAAGRAFLEAACAQAEQHE